jgi:hypothetical protein
MTKLAAIYTNTLTIFVGQALGLTFGNPAALPPRGASRRQPITTNRIYTRRTALTKTTSPHHQFYVRMGYAPFKSMEFFALVGGADLDWKWTHKSTMNKYYLDGSWELSAGGGLRMKTPWEFDAFGFKWHHLGKHHWCFSNRTIQLWISRESLVSKLPRKFNVTMRQRYFCIQPQICDNSLWWSQTFAILTHGQITVATTTSTGVSTRGDFLLGTSTGNDNPLTIHCYTCFWIKLAPYAVHGFRIWNLSG